MLSNQNRSCLFSVVVDGSSTTTLTSNSAVINNFVNFYKQRSGYFSPKVLSKRKFRKLSLQNRQLEISMHFVMKNCDHFSFKLMKVHWVHLHRLHPPGFTPDVEYVSSCLMFVVVVVVVGNWTLDFMIP